MSFWKPPLLHLFFMLLFLTQQTSTLLKLLFPPHPLVKPFFLPSSLVPFLLNSSYLISFIFFPINPSPRSRLTILIFLYCTSQKCKTLLWQVFWHLSASLSFSSLFSCPCFAPSPLRPLWTFFFWRPWNYLWNLWRTCPALSLSLTLYSTPSKQNFLTKLSVSLFTSPLSVKWCSIK